MNEKLLALYGLKWNPFAPGVPAEALHVSPRVAQLTETGGFALVTGEPGAGKSTALRILAHRLAADRDAAIGIISRPQAHMADFYREMGEIFDIKVSSHNRWAGSKTMRQRWQAHIDGSLSRPILIVDEAQEMKSQVLAELRLLVSMRLDSQTLLTTILAGDGRLLERLRSEEFLPLESRIRVRLAMERADADALQACLRHAMQQAGAPSLITPEVIATLADHAQGNLRALMIMADELLAAAAERGARQIDETLYFELYAPALDVKKAAGTKRR